MAFFLFASMIGGVSAVAPLGGLSDQTDILLDDSADAMPMSSRDLFYVKGTGVSNLLTTYGVSGKSFTKSSLAYDNVYVSGILTHSASNQSEVMRGGVCYYIPRTDTFVPEVYALFTSGVANKSEYRAKSDLSPNLTYYGFIKNLLSVGEVSGSIYVVGIDDENI